MVSTGLPGISSAHSRQARVESQWWAKVGSGLPFGVSVPVNPVAAPQGTVALRQSGSLVHPPGTPASDKARRALVAYRYYCAVGSCADLARGEEHTAAEATGTGRSKYY